MMHSFDAEWEHAARTDRTGPRRDQRANVTRPDQEDSSSDHKEDGDFATTNLDEAEAVAKARDGDVLKRMERERQQLLHHGAKSILHKRSPTALLNKPRTPLELASPKTRRKFYASREPAITKVIFSGIQPTGIPHLGNYLGALRGWVQLQNEADSNTKLIFSLVDLHALTVQQNPEALRKQKLDSFATLMAIGLDPQQCTIFHQSDVSAHAELMWILSCQASTGHLSRMTQWKDKTGDESEESGKLKLGLFSYPVLQAADILVHGATHVPVGEDQAQHLEFTRDLASSFNHNFGGLLKSTLLTPPQTIISPAKRIRSLTDPALKMSKSHPNDKSRILLTDDENVIRNKIKTAVTDSIETEITYDPETRPGISNLIDILYYADPDYKAPTINDPTKIPNEQEESPSDLPSTEPTEAFNPIAQAAAELAAKHALAADLADLSKKAFKDRVADVVEETVKPIREKFSSLVGNPSLLEMEAELGARKARENAEVCLGRVRRAVGLR
jgi:tryptophanyl-tRNA synthetase